MPNDRVAGPNTESPTSHTSGWPRGAAPAVVFPAPPEGRPGRGP